MVTIEQHLLLIDTSDPHQPLLVATPFDAQLLTDAQVSLSRKHPSEDFQPIFVEPQSVGLLHRQVDILHLIDLHPDHFPLQGGKNLFVAQDKGERLVVVALSEAEIHWRTFISSLLDRGMRGVQMVVSDAHEGIKAALRTAMPGIP